jgi:anti-sigma B factor antagonist
MDPTDLLLTTRWSNGHRIVVVTGEIDICTAPALRAYLLDATVASPDCGDLVVDLSAVPFIDICGLTDLLRADRQIRRSGRRLRLACPTAPVTRLLAITHLDLYFELYLTSDAAVR